MSLRVSSQQKELQLLSVVAVDLRGRKGQSSKILWGSVIN